MVRAARHLLPNQTCDANTIIGDKLIGATIGKQMGSDGWPVDDSFHEIVLRSSAQCLPMIMFDKALRNHKDGKECVRYMKKSLQDILDRLFNKGLQNSDFRNAPLITATTLHPARAAIPAPMPLPGWPPVPPPYTAPGVNYLPGISPALHAVSSLPAGRLRTRRTQFASRVAAANPRASSTSQTLRYTAPWSLTTGIPSNALTAPPVSCNMKEKCVICHDRLEQSLCVALNACKHVFHSQCLELSLRSKPQCPVCRVSVGAPQGKSPSGTMTVSFSPIRCSGFQEDSIVITYTLPSGRQLSYHDNPGKNHGGKVAMAYLPRNSDGQDLLKRLKFSFNHGLTFSVGTSITTGLADQCTWTSVHHKTSPSGGTRAHGYPDPDYFHNCNGELDGISVPHAQSLDDDGNEKYR
mmetsp:Transcript_29909/g.63431  ORF Transcript_29909/g.63431 Transcript_29909/m.63431 type:complete len:409 (+) Transcript_29909:112-1338(+)